MISRDLLLTDHACGEGEAKDTVQLGKCEVMQFDIVIVPHYGNKDQGLGLKENISNEGGGSPNE
jgi:hypothetical protein